MSAAFVALPNDLVTLVSSVDFSRVAPPGDWGPQRHPT
jgi:hypothetical protein